MKEIDSKLFRPQRWSNLFGKSAFLILFAFCFAGLQSLEAQVVQPVGLGSKTVKHKIETCEDASVQYTDDNSNDKLLYADYGTDKDGKVLTTGRTDTVELCPQDEWHYINVTITDFDIAAGDTLFAFDGSIDSLQAGNAPVVGTGTGTGVSNAFESGWVSANCSPDINATGCLTFVFKTTPDNRKGLGWDAWVSCSSRNIRLDRADVRSVKLACDDVTADVIAPAPRVRTDCGDIDAAVLVYEIRNQAGMLCQTGTTTVGGAADVNVTGLGAGSYTVEWYLPSDPTKTTGKRVFSVSLPALVCNDDVRIPLGASCVVEIAPDDILENQCDPLPAHLAYNVTVKFGSGKLQVITGSGSGATSGTKAWPIITRDLLEDAGVDVCEGTAEVTIERVYTPTMAATCDNGVIKQSCTTTVNFFDNVAPTPIIAITNGVVTDTLIACDEESFRSMLSATAIDNCNDVTAELSIRFNENDPCFSTGSDFGADTTRAVVTATATDACGNTGTALRTFIILRPTLDNEIVKPESGKFECDESDVTAPTPGLRVGYVTNTGDRIYTDTIYDKLSTTDYYCGYILNDDERHPIPSTDCGKKEFVVWKVLDWCKPENGLSIIDTSFIEYTDTKAPLFTDTLAERRGINIDNSRRVDDDEYFKVTDTLTLDLGHFDCTFDVSKVTKPAATDNCDLTPDVSLANIIAYEGGDNPFWSLGTSDTELECGTYYLVWAVNDDCHEQTDGDILYQPVVIRDVTLPSAVCVDQLNVSLPNEWGARVYVADVDAGSFDACGIKSKLIRIKGADQPWAEYVEIGCEYLHPDLQIEMQVIDNKDNENICWLDVAVEDKINPICEELPSVTKECDAFHNDELGVSTDTDGDSKFDDDEWTALEGDLMAVYNDNFGNPVCEDNLKTSAGCASLTIEQEYQLIAWPCGEIEAKRRYRAIDWSDNESAWVTQDIKITYRANWKITFPGDWEGTCGELAPVESIVIVNGACDLLGYEVTEKQFDIPGDACFKIERTYHVINWCKYVAGDPATDISRPEGEHGYSEGTMISSDGFNDNTGYFTYIQVLKVHDEEAPVVTVIDPTPCIDGIEFDALPYGEEDQTPGSAPYECDEPKTWRAEATDCSTKITWIGRLFDASTGEMVKEVESNELTHVVSNKDSYYAEFWAYDNCGNSAGERGADIFFWDCKKPTPYVLNGIAVEIMQTRMAQVWATDLDQNSFDNCTDQSFLDFRIWHASLGDAPTTDEGVNALGKVITLGCDYIGTQVINIYVIDEEGNWDFATTYVIIQDNMNACQGTEPGNGNMVAGAIVNADGQNVELATIAVNGGADESMTTGADGHFQFMLPNGGDYTVTPEKDMNPLNGVSTFDLVLISKHILGISTFDTPYKHIAADVNKSGSITAFDMVQLRQLILNITSEFPSNDSWRFVDASYNFTSANPAAENFNEFYSINNLNADMMNMDFVGVKIGDVNGNAQANSLVSAEVRNTNGALTFNVADQFVEAGQTVTVDFASANIASAQGYQFTMNFAGLELANVVEGVAKAANFNTNLAERGVLATSWNGEATADDVLFSLTFTATTDGLLSDLVSVSSDLTVAEAYNTAGELLDVNIEFSNAVAAGFELGQNTPNPFKTETTIGFNLPTAGAATLKVMDIQGKVLKVVSGDFAKGYNTVTINAKELGATGVLHYQLESADQVSTKKMIIIE